MALELITNSLRGPVVTARMRKSPPSATASLTVLAPTWQTSTAPDRTAATQLFELPRKSVISSLMPCLAKTSGAAPPISVEA